MKIIKIKRIIIIFSFVAACIFFLACCFNKTNVFCGLNYFWVGVITLLYVLYVGNSVDIDGIINSLKKNKIL